MLNKIYDKIKKIINENYIYLILLLVIVTIFYLPLPYYIDAPGGLIDVSERLEVEDGYPINGSLNLAYISEFKANIPTIIYALFNNDWDIIKKEDVVADNETIEENDYRNHLLLEEANQNAIMVAFDKANLDYKVNNCKVNIIYIYEQSDTDLKIGDQIVEVNGVKINSKEEALNEISKKDNIKFKVINDGVEYERYANKVMIDGNKLVGVMVCETKEVTPSKKVNINFKKSESGPSGGFMMSLSIYDSLTEEDLTKGLKIVGTGTIDEFGNVGVIGGVNHKIKAAVKEKADIFFVPTENYEEAKKTVLEDNLDIELIEVKHIDDAIEYLNGL